MRKAPVGMEHPWGRSVALPLDNRNLGSIDRVLGEVSGTIKRALAKHRAALIIFIALQLGDLISTYVALRVGLWEANPVADSILPIAGEGGLYALKLAWVAGVLGVAVLLEKRYAHIWRAIYIINVIMVMIVMSNALQAALSILSA